MHTSRSWRRLVFAVAVGVSAIVLLGGVSFGQKTTIVHLHDFQHGQEWRDWLNASKEAFETENPDIEIELIFPVSHEAYADLVISMYATGMLPDVVETFPRTGYHLARAGVYRDLDEFVARDEEIDWSDFFPVAVHSAEMFTGEHVGAHWYLPLSVWVLGTAYNLDHFNESGLVAPPLENRDITWDELSRVGRRLMRTEGDGTVTRWGAMVATTVRGRLTLWVHAAGGAFLDNPHDPTESLFNTEPVRTALTYLQEQTALGYIGGSFNNGTTAIHTAVGPNYTSQHNAQQRAFDYALGGPPVLRRGGTQTIVIGVAMSQQTENPEQAWKWMKFLSTGAAESHIAITGRPVAYGEAARRHHELLPGASPWDRVWTNLMASPDSFPQPVMPDDAVLSPQLDDIVTRVLRGALDVGVAVETMHQLATAAIARERERQVRE